MTTDEKLVYTTDICGKIAAQIKALGSAEAVLCKMFAPPRHYDDVRIWSVTVAQCFGMDADTFMAEYKRLRSVARQLANAASKESKE
jgi:hypothetical protein